MNKASNTAYSIGTATHAAKRAAAIVHVLQNKEKLGHIVLIQQLNNVLQEYGEEDPKIKSVEVDELTGVSQKLYAVFVTKDTQHAVRLINTFLSDFASAPRLSMHNNTPWHLHIDSDNLAP